MKNLNGDRDGGIAHADVPRLRGPDLVQPPLEGQSRIVRRHRRGGKGLVNIIYRVPFDEIEYVGRIGDQLSDTGTVRFGETRVDPREVWSRVFHPVLFMERIMRAVC